MVEVKNRLCEVWGQSMDSQQQRIGSNGKFRTRIVATYRTWGRDRYRRLIWGFIKRSFRLCLALLKPIVKVAEIISIPALFKFVKVSEAIIIIVGRIAVKGFVVWLM